MPLMIIWRKTGVINQFRVALHQLIEGVGDELILSSGYVSHGSQFSVDDWSNIFPSLDMALTNGLEKVTIRAGKFGKHSSTATYNLSALNRVVSAKSSYQERYEAFLSNLIPFLINKRKSIRIDAYIHDNWHAKVSVKADNGTPFAAIIGSSNLTSTAYGNFTNNFNSECDVLIWRLDYHSSNKFRFLYDENLDGENKKIIHFNSGLDYVFFESLPKSEREFRYDEEYRLNEIYKNVKDAEGGKKVEI